MRFVAIALFLLAIPLLQAWMRQGVRQQRYVWMAVGFMPFVIGWWHLDASLISWAHWPGYVKGMLVSLLDAVAVAVLLTMRGDRARTPFVGLIVAYLLAATLAIASAEVKQAAFFFAWQLARMLLVFLAVSRIASRPDGPRYVIYGLMAGATVQAGFSVSQWLQGIDQAAGTMGHQNLLGMATHFAIYPALALLLAGRRDAILLIGFAASVIAVVLTGSRGTIGFAGIGVVLLILMSMVRRPTGAKTGIAVAGVLALLAASPVAYSLLNKRLTADSMASSDEERESFKRAAWMMIRDHPMGVGPNQYVIVANSGGYSERAGVNWNTASRATHVHHTYLLMTAEMGFIGAAAFIALMLLPIAAALRFAWTRRRDPRGDLALGLAVTLIAVAAHCLYEWIYVLFTIQYLHGICLGLVAGLILQRRRERRRGRPRAQPEPLAPPRQPTPATA